MPKYKYKTMDFTYRIIDHTADLGVEVVADNLTGLLKGSLQALGDWLGVKVSFSEVDSCQPDHFIESEDYLIESTESELTEQLVEVLNDWLFLVQGKHQLPKVHYISWEPERLRIYWSQLLPLAPEQLEGEIKAVTYHGVQVLSPDDVSSYWRAAWIADL